MNAKKASQIFARSIKGTLLQSVALAIAFSFTALSVTARADEPRLDGLFLEWSSANLIATDPAGDATGAFDIQNVYATNRGTRLFLRFDISSTLNMQSGLTANGTLIAQIAMPNNRFLSIDMRNRKIWHDNDPALTVTNESVGYAVAPSYASNEFELGIDLQMFGVVLGSPITINFSSSDSLASAVAYTMSRSEIIATRRSADRSPGTTFRIASLNTYGTGLLNSTRRPQIQRLVDAMNADIYCFQEEYYSNPADIAQALAEANPTDDGATWNVSQYYDMAIASRSPLISLSSGSGRHGVIVDLPGEGPEDAAVIFSIHPKCCGYIGSSSDLTRISQMNDLITTVTDLRAGTFGSQYEPYRQAPIIIIGDWNLVGSRTPLDLVTDPAGLNMVDALPANLIGEDVMTWRTNTGETFCPGRLDLMAYQASNGLGLLGSFILDSALLNPAELLTLGLQSTDSSCSDHLMLVGDFRFSAGDPTCVGDLNQDHAVDSADLGTLLGLFGPCQSGALGDFNFDAAIDSSDLGTMLGNFGPCPPSWAKVLQWNPDSDVVPDADVRAKIVASGFPWRVLDTGTGIEMLLIPGGTFNMGCSASNNDSCSSVENPTHQVTLSKAFYLGKTEVTQAQWQAKMSSNPSYFSGNANNPVERVSWNDIAGFNTATGLRLPSEAEWEYACRGGTTTAFHSMPGYPNGTNDDSLLGYIAWYNSNSGSTTHAVAGKAANAFGMYDMSGNVWEWCNDWYGSYAAGNATDPAGPSLGWARVLRGGNWSYGSDGCRSSGRNGGVPDYRDSYVGFRVARTP